MDAILLAGGQGKRLRPLTNEIPKCMIPLNGRPMLQYNLDLLKKFKINRTIVACGYKWEKIQEVYGNSLIYSVEEEPLGTAGAIKLALDKVEGDEFLVINGDDLANLDISKIMKIGSNVTVVSRFHSQFGIAEIKNDKIVKFVEKPLLPDYWANIGTHLLNKKIRFPEKGSFEADVLPKIAQKGELKVYKHPGFWVTVNVQKDVEEAEKVLAKNKGL